MSVQMSWLLRQQHLRLSHRGGPERSAAPITFAQATELIDPSPWLSGGELILTTGLGFDADGPALGTYVRTLAAAGVACLGFGVGLSHSTIPRHILDTAEDVGLPVVEVPYDIPFAAVIRAVMKRIAEQEYEQVLRAASVQTRITRAALHGGVDAIVRELAVATSTSVALIGNRTESFHPAAAADLVERARDVARSIRPSSAPATVSVSEPGCTVTLHSVAISGGASSFLAIRTAGPVTGVEQILLGHAVSLVTLELEKPTRLRAEQSRLNTLALGLLLDGHLPSPDGTALPSYLVDAADDDSRIRVAVVRGPSERIVEAIDAECRARARPTFTRQTDTGVVVLFRGTDDSDVVARLFDSLPRSVRVGLSSSLPITETPVALKQASLACAAAGSGDRIVEFTGSMLLASEPVQESLRAMAAVTVAVLSEYDRTHTADLVGSLRAFLEANGHWETAAANLSVHRHTLRNRITRCEELLSVDLTSARVRAELLLSLLAATS
ncbi:MULTISPECIES: PucR family transcriptional regulator [unclassified Rhodococcus (in: high G+C Gram-positive bacteria)]|uniref:PucR family transcriptional regulator n=1 Tax=unclassified Rhodococcus (in: high G+C Gram-positive bacteria) TaxID=192944 RepID=UPI002953893F|nr:PucR family transcriptional regulator ligand-binding domain-containing protein [Rhodococcus sp. IEGM 1343]MDV8053706.1 PucR family transcriptional regulator ligand-binding domain-containing protein [Rhodococcus sp. IEGM 1343]